MNVKKRYPRKTFNNKLEPFIVQYKTMKKEMAKKKTLRVIESEGNATIT